MKYLSHNQSGLAHVALVVIILLVVGAVGFAGWRVHSTTDPTSKSATASKALAVQQAIDTTDWQTYSSPKYGYALKYPTDWQVSTDSHFAYWIMFKKRTSTQVQITEYDKPTLERTVSYETDKAVTMNEYARRLAEKRICDPGKVDANSGCVGITPTVKKITANGAEGYAREGGKQSAAAVFGIKNHDAVIEIVDQSGDNAALFNAIITSFRLTD